MDDWTALIPTIVREADLRELVDFTRRWNQPPVTVAAGVGVAAIMLLTGIVFAPAALSEFPAGSFVLLAWLLYDFGTTPIYWGTSSTAGSRPAKPDTTTICFGRVPPTRPRSTR